jgi:hypothetical protein
MKLFKMLLLLTSILVLLHIPFLISSTHYVLPGQEKTYYVGSGYLLGVTFSSAHCNTITVQINGENETLSNGIQSDFSVSGVASIISQDGQFVLKVVIFPTVVLKLEYASFSIPSTLFLVFIIRRERFHLKEFES